VDWVQEARGTAAGIVINPAALTHTSVAVLDALNSFDGPVIELHISQVHKREAFRHHSYVSQRADAVMAGFGVHGYELALRHMAQLLG
jgi:3-dehydroquinate dehydratase-2